MHALAGLLRTAPEPEWRAELQRAETIDPSLARALRHARSMAALSEPPDGALSEQSAKELCGVVPAEWRPSLETFASTAPSWLAAGVAALLIVRHEQHRPGDAHRNDGVKQALSSNLRGWMKWIKKTRAWQKDRGSEKGVHRLEVLKYSRTGKGGLLVKRRESTPRGVLSRERLLQHAKLTQLRIGACLRARGSGEDPHDYCAKLLAIAERLPAGAGEQEKLVQHGLLEAFGVHELKHGAGDPTLEKFLAWRGPRSSEPQVDALWPAKPCKRCGSTRVRLETENFRSSDEAHTYRRVCQDCHTC